MVLVVFTTGVVGWVTWLVLPGVAVAAALALGAVVAPPDAVAAAALGRRLGLPRKVATLLEQESLVNDAAALIALTVAVSALTSSPSAPEVAGDFVWAVVGAVLIGLAVAAVLAMVRARLRDPVLDTLISFVAPYLAFLPAEEVHASGVLATVVTGLTLAHLSPRVQTASARVTEAITWRTVAFVLENAVFLVIGLQLPGLLSDAGDSELGAGRIVAVCAGGARRPPSSPGSSSSSGWPGSSRRARPGCGARRGATAVAGLVSWAGMRGVVTLAAAQLLPEDLPDREVLLLAAFTVVVGSLLVQGSTLPWLVRRVGLPGAGPGRGRAARRRAGGRRQRRRAAPAGRAGHRRRARGRVKRLRDRSVARSHAAWERLGRPLADQETPSNTYARLRMADARRRAGGGHPRPGRRHGAGGGAVHGPGGDRRRGVAARPAGRAGVPGPRPRAGAGPPRRPLRAPAARAGGRAAPGVGLRGLPGRGDDVGAPAHLPELRARRVLRLLARAGTPGPTSAPRGTPWWSAPSRARRGAGAGWTRNWAERRRSSGW